MEWCRPLVEQINQKHVGHWYLRLFVPLVQFSKQKKKQIMKRFPIFSVQIVYYQIDQKHK